MHLFFLLPLIFGIIGLLFSAILTWGVPQIPGFQVHLGKLRRRDFEKMPPPLRRRLRRAVLLYTAATAILTAVAGGLPRLPGLCGVMALQWGIAVLLYLPLHRTTARIKAQMDSEAEGL